MPASQTSWFLALFFTFWLIFLWLILTLQSTIMMLQLNDFISDIITRFWGQSPRRRYNVYSNMLKKASDFLYDLLSRLDDPHPQVRRNVFSQTVCIHTPRYILINAAFFQFFISRTIWKKGILQVFSPGGVTYFLYMYQSFSPAHLNSFCLR